MGALETRSAFSICNTQAPLRLHSPWPGRKLLSKKVLVQDISAPPATRACAGARSPLSAAMHAMWAQQRSCSRACDNIITHRVVAQLEEEIQEDLKWSILVKKKLYSGKSDFQTVELIESGPFAKARLLRLRRGPAGRRADTFC